MKAAMCAGFYKADNPIAFVDNNNLQLDGSLKRLCLPYPISDKFKAFCWNVIEIDGHDVEQIADAVELASVVPENLQSRTYYCGKGVSLFENNVDFGGQPNRNSMHVFAELDADLRNWRTDKMGENISNKSSIWTCIEFGADENIYVFGLDLKCTMTLLFSRNIRNVLQHRYC